MSIDDELQLEQLFSASVEAVEPVLQGA